MMAKTIIHNIKLGIFVIAGLTFLILLLYMIGKNQNLFGKTFLLKARFENVHGLMPGNNVRMGGIDAGTVNDIKMINDTSIEVSMFIKTKMKDFIHKNARITITTDGLMGNKLINIDAVKEPAPLVEEGDILQSAQVTSIDEMLKVLGNTNNDVAAIASELKSASRRFNNSSAFWNILSDNSLPQNFRSSLNNVRIATEKINLALSDLNLIVSDLYNGKGSVGRLLRDTAFAGNLNDAITRIKSIAATTDSLAGRVNTLIGTVTNEINNGKGAANAVLKDSSIANDLRRTLNNLEKGTAAFNDNMEAIKHSFLLRGYFRKLEKNKQATSDKNIY